MFYCIPSLLITSAKFKVFKVTNCPKSLLTWCSWRARCSVVTGRHQNSDVDGIRSSNSSGMIKEHHKFGGFWPNLVQIRTNACICIVRGWKWSELEGKCENFDWFWRSRRKLYRKRSVNSFRLSFSGQELDWTDTWAHVFPHYFVSSVVFWAENRRTNKDFSCELQL